MLRNPLYILADAALRPGASAAVFSLWLAWSPVGPQLSNDRDLAASVGFLVPNSDSSSASLVRSRQRDGRESLTGRTQYALHGVLRLLIVEESSELADSGRLVRADVHLRYVARGTEPLPQGLIAQVLFDASTGLLRATDQQGVTRERHVATSAAWVYVPVSLPSGVMLSTPVAVAVARAASRVGSDVLRVSVDTEVNISTDQLCVSGTNEEWLLLGDDLATFRCNSFGCDELMKLHVAPLGIDLTPSATERASM